MVDQTFVDSLLLEVDLIDPRIQRLVEGMEKRQVQFDPDIREEQIGLSSIDLRLGYVFTKHKAVAGLTVDPLADGFEPSNITETFDLSQRTPPPGQTETYILKPNNFVLSRTLEKLRLPRNLAAQVQGVTSGARAGLCVHATAPHIHPGFSGSITLELSNLGSWDLRLTPEMRICQLIFFKVMTPVSLRDVAAMTSYQDQALPFPKRQISKSKLA